MGETILVTGGGSGIGLAVVEAALAEGCRAVAVDRDAAALERLGGRDRLTVLALDVADEAAVAAAIARIDRETPLTGVVNCAGIAADVPLLETTTADFRRILEVNLVGSFVVTREAVRHMLPRGRGSIVNIASVSGIMGNKGRSAYGASKGGIITMTRVHAVELAGQGIRVNAVAPGPIDTPMAQAVHTEAARRTWTEITPQRRYGTPHEVAAAVLFLLDDARSGYITGHTLCVDGGFSIAGLMEHAGA